jgi:predicted nucleic acid-binding protein
MNRNKSILFDAGVFIGALLKGDPRHQEARSIVESARWGDLSVYTSTSILSEVYAALTWVNAQPQHSPSEAANAVQLLVKPPSAIKILSDGLEASIKMLEISEKYSLTARRVHDAKHAATALVNNITSIFTYDITEWKKFEPEGLTISGPPSTLINLAKNR